MNANDVTLKPNIKAVLFDLDGVLTPTAEVHEEAWRRLFAPYLELKGAAPYTDEDYFEYLDGRARYDAVAGLLESRGIDIPYGTPLDSPEDETICGLGNRKNAEFNATIESTGIQPYAGSAAFLDYIEALGPLKVAVVSSSKNAPQVLKAAGMLEHFPVIVDGNVAAERGLTGKPSPATYLDAATQLGVAPEDCAVVEDAVSGVQAGAAGNFGMIIGVDRGAGADVLAQNGATVVVDDLDQFVMAASGVDTMDRDWLISENQFLSDDQDVVSSLLALSNGYLGIRGDMGIRLRQDSRGTYLNGLHETWAINHAEDAYGLARIGQSMVTLPDGTALDLEINGHAITDDGAGAILGYTRVLDIKSATLHQAFVWKSPDGARFDVRQRSTVSLVDAHIAAVELSVTPLDKGGKVVITSSVDSPLTPPMVVAEGVTLELDDPRKANKQIEGAVGLTDVEQSATGGVIEYQVQASQMAAAVAVSNTATLGGSQIEVHAAQTLPMASAAWETAADVGAGSTLSLTKVLSYARDDLFEEHPGNPAPEAADALAQTDAEPTSLFRTQRDAAHTLWETADVVITQDGSADTRPGNITDYPARGAASLQATIRWCLFQILQSSIKLQDSGVPAKALTGSGYDGHYFWDAEIYVLPYLVYANPQAARDLLHYRYLTLPAARRRAKEMDEDGALFPWRTIAGPESSAYYPAGTAQYHINAAVAYAVNQYLNATGDTDFLRDEAIDILVETARMWLSLGFVHGPDGKFHIHGVTGPDEYTAVVNDNMYTNVMAQANLRNAAKWLRRIETDDPGHYEVVLRRLLLSADEIASFGATADIMSIPWNDALGLHPQDEAFLNKQRWDFDGTPQDKYPLLLNYHPLVIYRHQVLKQSDTVLALYLLSSQFTDEEKRADFEYYDSITTGDSSLSAAAQAIMAAEVGHQNLAAQYFEKLLGVDIADLHHNTDAGLHIASLGGTWSALIMGFAGLRDDTGTLRFSPRLPGNWTSMRFTLMRGGYPLDVEVSRTGVTFNYRAPADKTVEVEVEGEGAQVPGSL